MFMVKDLVLDLTLFYYQYKCMEPWLKTMKPSAALAGQECEKKQ
jgi:succinate dehydrogenase/fumarate reductase-like Fe-S protein